MDILEFTFDTDQLISTLGISPEVQKELEPGVNYAGEVYMTADDQYGTNFKTVLTLTPHSIDED